MTEAQKIIPIDGALAAVALAEQRLAAVGGLIDTDEMTAADARSWNRISYRETQEKEFPFSNPTFRDRIMAEHGLRAALADYLVRAGGNDQRLAELESRLFRRAVRVGSAASFDGGILSPRQFEARKQQLIGRLRILSQGPFALLFPDASRN